MAADRDTGVVELGSVPGFVVFDLPGAPLSAGGTRLAADVSVAEVALLARAMTYKFAALGQQGTAEEDFAPLRAGRAAPTAMSSVVDGVPFEDVVTGYGVTVAAGAALDASPGGAGHGGTGQGWDGRSVAIEGFGKVGGGVAREVIRRGGRVVAASTVAGCVADPAGLDVGRLFALRHEYGDECVLRYGGPVIPPGGLFTEVSADVLVPGTRPGTIGGRTAAAVPPGVRVVAPAANAPYTAQGAAVLRQRGIVALPDFVCNGGAVIGYRSPSDATPGQVLAGIEATIGGLIRQALDHEDGPLTGASERAAEFLRGWWGEPPPPPFAPAG